MTKTVYKLSNINGRFEHAYGKRAAIARAAKIEGEGNPTEQVMREYGWTFERLTPAQARAVGMALGKESGQ